MSITKQSYSEARNKISPDAFKTLFSAIVKWFYDDDQFCKYKGYRLLAIDGSLFELNNSQKLRDAFGTKGNHLKQVARALASEIYDIENDIIIAALITKCTTSERVAMLDLIEQFKKIGVKKDLFLLDRGYPSAKAMLIFEGMGAKYLIRASTVFSKVVNQAKKPDQWVTLKDEKGTPVNVRVVRILLDSGEEEILLTNLPETEFGINDLKELYFKRWGIETKYNELKNKLQIENFTGDTPITVEQDFYATMYLTNMASLAKSDANAKISEKNKTKGLKYEYKVNVNVLISQMREEFISIVLNENPRTQAKQIEKMMKQIQRHVVPIRPNRTFERSKNLKSNRFSFNTKKCL